MSRIGKSPIAIPAGVTVAVDNSAITVTGPKGTLSQFTMPGVTVSVSEGVAMVTRASDEREDRSKHGLMRSLVANMVTGVTEGFKKQLELNGVGYRVAMEGNRLKFAIGYSHDVFYPVPEGIQVAVEQNIITVSGIDKQKVGQVAAEIRALRKPEPYKGKGLKYIDERIIRKSGKSGKEKA